MLLKFYDLLLYWAKHSRAPWLLGCLSFAESIFMPIPPDLMLAPMSLAKPDAAWKYALITTVCSVLGGLCGYCLGYYFAPKILDLMADSGYSLTYYFQVKSLFAKWGGVAIFLVGFTPIPYKLFTISAGLLNLNLSAFILASFLGRGVRFWIVSSLLRLHAKKLDQVLRNFALHYGKIFLILISLLVVISVFYYLN